MEINYRLTDFSYFSIRIFALFKITALSLKKIMCNVF